MSKVCFIVGHGKSKSGGYDPGATVNGYHEYRIAKEIAEYAQTYYNANFTEHADIMNADASLYLSDRIKKVNQMGYDFVAEIHLNAALTAGGGTGTECYYHKGNEKGRAYADAICKEISAALGVTQRSNGIDDGGDKIKLNSAGNDYFAIIRETPCTTVLVECVFINTPADLEKVSTPDGQAACGAAIAEAVAKVRGAKRKEISAGSSASGNIYRVQVGAYRKLENAEAMLRKVKAAGFADAFIKSV